jgi:hypothetical protein
MLTQKPPHARRPSAQGYLHPSAWLSFQLHGVNGADQPVLRKKLRRKEMVAFFEKRPPTVMGGVEGILGSRDQLQMSIAQLSVQDRDSGSEYTLCSSRRPAHLSTFIHPSVDQGVGG